MLMSKCLARSAERRDASLGGRGFGPTGHRGRHCRGLAQDRERLANRGVRQGAYRLGVGIVIGRLAGFGLGPHRQHQPLDVRGLEPIQPEHTKGAGSKCLRERLAYNSLVAALRSLAASVVARQCTSHAPTFRWRLGWIALFEAILHLVQFGQRQLLGRCVDAEALALAGNGIDVTEPGFPPSVWTVPNCSATVCCPLCHGLILPANWGKNWGQMPFRRLSV